MKTIHIIMLIFCVVGNIVMWTVNVITEALWGIIALIPFFIWVLIMNKLDAYSEDSE